MRQVTNLPATNMGHQYGELTIIALKGNHVFAEQVIDYGYVDATAERVEKDMSDLFTDANHEPEFVVHPGQYNIGQTVRVFGEIVVPPAVVTAIKAGQANLKAAEKKVKEAEKALAETRKAELATRTDLNKFLAEASKNN